MYKGIEAGLLNTLDATVEVPNVQFDSFTFNQCIMNQM